MNLVNLVSSDQPSPSQVPKLRHRLSNKGRCVVSHLGQLDRCHRPEAIFVMTAASNSSQREFR